MGRDLTIREHREAIAREKEEASRADTRARRPIVYVSTSDGLITEWEAYAPDGTRISHDDLPVRIIQIDWDDVTRADIEDEDEDWPVDYVREVIADETLPKSLRDDIAISLAHARRFDDHID